MNQCSNQRKILFSRWNAPPNLREIFFLVGTPLRTIGKFFFSLERPSKPTGNFFSRWNDPQNHREFFFLVGTTLRTIENFYFLVGTTLRTIGKFFFSLERPSEPTKNFIFLTYASLRQRSKKKSANIVCVCEFFFRCGSRAYEFIESKNSSLSRVCAMRL